jgi:hypothetical protein
MRWALTKVFCSSVSAADATPDAMTSITAVTALDSAVVRMRTSIIEN